MGWETSTRRKDLPPDWKYIRRMVINRAGGLCERTRLDTGTRCAAPANEVDHKNDPHDHRLASLQLLCSWCHASKTGREAAEGRRRARQERVAAVEAVLRPRKRMPGAID